MSYSEEIQKRIEAKEEEIERLIEFINSSKNRLEEQGKKPNYGTIGAVAESVGKHVKEREQLVNLKMKVEGGFNNE